MLSSSFGALPLKLYQSISYSLENCSKGKMRIFLKNVKGIMKRAAVHSLPEKPPGFSSRLYNAVTFALRRKSPRAAGCKALLRKTLQGIQSYSRRAAAPSSSPAVAVPCSVAHGA